VTKEVIPKLLIVYATPSEEDPFTMAMTLLSCCAAHLLAWVVIFTC
jgi:hypothetical protein